jgi:Mlc titration factor MtfA (ptsG expression regulator)
VAPVSILLFILLAAAVIAVLKIKIAARTRNKLFNTPPPNHWAGILDQTFSITEKLTDEQRNKLFGYMQIFLSKTAFEGCGGLELTEEMRITVAAQACMLLIGRNTKVFPKLKTVILYPHTYRSGTKGTFGGTNGEGSRLGESWDCGVVVLAWNSVLGGARNMEDGQNVTFHEFAHQLDQEDGAADGAPILEERSAYSAWARVFNREYRQLVDKTKRGRKRVMDQYGATNPAEFFAVATETFFEKPRQLKQKRPELYEELQHYYKVDPILWT